MAPAGRQKHPFEEVHVVAAWLFGEQNVLRSFFAMPNATPRENIRFRGDYIIRRRYAGALAVRVGIAKAARCTGLPQYIVQYWRDKFLDPSYHPKSWGGRYRQHRFQVAIHIALFHLCKQNSTYNLREFRTKLRELNPNWNISLSTLSRIFKSWRWSFKKPDRYQYLKYRRENIERYVAYLAGIDDIPWIRLKFLDESKFISKGKYFISLLLYCLRADFSLQQISKDQPWSVR